MEIEKTGPARIIASDNDSFRHHFPADIIAGFFPGNNFLLGIN